MKLDRSCDAVTAVELYIHISLSCAKPASLHENSLKVAVTFSPRDRPMLWNGID